MRDAPGRRPRRTTLSPHAFDQGEIAWQTAVEDRLGAHRDSPRALVVQALLDHLPEPDQSAVRMMLAGLSYAEAGRLLGAEEDPPREIDMKTMWRWCNRGLEQLHAFITGSPWAYELLGIDPDIPFVPQPRPFDEAITKEAPDGD